MRKGSHLRISMPVTYATRWGCILDASVKPLSRIVDRHCLSTGSKLHPQRRCGFDLQHTWTEVRCCHTSLLIPLPRTSIGAKKLNRQGECDILLVSFASCTEKRLLGLYREPCESGKDIPYPIISGGKAHGSARFDPKFRISYPENNQETVSDVRRIVF